MPSEYVICVCNDNYAASLELRKIYRTLPDFDASAHKKLRVIDESGEDCLYPIHFFLPIEIPESTRILFANQMEERAARGSRQKFERALNKVKNVPAEPADQL